MTYPQLVEALQSGNFHIYNTPNDSGPTITCTSNYYLSMCDFELGECHHCPYLADESCTMPSPAEFANFKPTLLRKHPEFFL